MSRAIGKHSNAPTTSRMFVSQHGNEMNILVRGHKDVSATMFTDVMERLRAMKIGVIHDDGSLGDMPRIWAYHNRIYHCENPHGHQPLVDLIVEFK